MEDKGSSSKAKEPLAGPLPKPNAPHTPKRPRRNADVSEPGSFTPRRALEQAADEKQTELRLMIAKRMKEETVYCTDEHFIEHYLPPIPDTVSVETIVKDLEEGKYLQKSEAHAQDLLGDFSVKPSEVKKKKRTQTNEKVIFAPLANVTTAIRGSAGASKNAFHMRMVPDTELESEIRGCTFKIDACTTATEKAPGTLHLTDIVVPLEFKVRNNQGETQKYPLIRRNFVFGITIEDDHVSMWYFSRTHSVKATSFSYVKNPEKLVHVLTALSCATEAQLGFDPRITLLPDMSYLYEFPVTEGDHATTINYAGKESGDSIAPSAEGHATPMPKALYFRTTASIGEARALRVAGRTTCVFKGKQVVSKENPTPIAGAVDVVVKDVWIGADNPTEVQIQKKLFEDIEEFAMAPDEGWKLHPLLEDFNENDKAALGLWLPNERYKDLFLCAVRESVGEGNKPVHPEAWDSDEIFIEAMLTEEAPDITGSKRTGSIPVTTAPRYPAMGGNGPSLVRTFSPKKRCFFLFQDVCTRVSVLPTLGEAIDVLRQTHLALMLMFCAGWVHRDISSGNVLAIKKDDSASWQAKLADLEYARKFPSDDAGSTDPKTGTPYFMACEIQSALSLFEVPAKPEDLFSRRPATNGGIRRAVDYKVVKKHTYAHDLESLWWLILWIITNLLAHPESYNDAWVYFQVNDLGQRRWLLTHGGLPVLHPDLTDFVEPLEEVRAVLMNGYRGRDPRTALGNLSTYKGACATYFDFFNGIKGNEATWEPMLLHPAPSRHQAADAPEDNATQPSGTTQSNSKKRKPARDGQEKATQEPVRRSSRLTTTTKPAAGSKADGPGPSKKARR